MKKIILIGVLLIPFVFSSCNKESIVDQHQIYTSSKKNNNTSNQKTVKVDVVHNGHTININENALMAHLQHGDKIGTVEDNVVLQGIITNAVSLSLNDPLYVAFRNSSDFLSYNQASFGNLLLSEAKLYTNQFNRQVIGIPTAPSKDGSITILLGFVSPNQIEFKSLVGKENLKIESTTVVAGLSINVLSGDFSYLTPTGNLLTTIQVDNNKITNFFIDPNPDPLPFVSCFKACFANARKECSQDFACSLACAVLQEVPCIIGTAICCAGNCGFGSGDPC